MALDSMILQRDLDLALGFHQGQRWPGSRIPDLAHALEGACRAAALGGDDATVLAALLETGWSRHPFR